MNKRPAILDQLERLQSLADCAARQYDCCSEYGPHADAFLANGLFLERLRLFPEVCEESPYGRLVEDRGNAWIEGPKKRRSLGS
jgi:hypothetical protein